MSELDKALGGLLGGQSGGDLGSILGGLTGGGGGGQAGGGNQMLGALLPVVGSLLAGGGLQKIVSGLQANGQGAQTSSWVGKGPNEPISGQQLREVVGDKELGAISQRLGVSDEQAADALADVLPKVVDHASPDGQLP
jgi:uncharacterized protein YidB (DUF937 family)